MDFPFFLLSRLRESHVRIVNAHLPSPVCITHESRLGSLVLPVIEMRTPSAEVIYRSLLGISSLFRSVRNSQLLRTALPSGSRGSAFAFLGLFLQILFRSVLFPLLSLRTRFRSRKIHTPRSCVLRFHRSLSGLS